MVIQRATVWHTAHIAAMWVKLELERGRKQEDLDAESFFLSMVTKIKHPEHAVFVAIDNDRPVAFINGSVGYRDSTNLLTGQCEYLYVEPEYRDKGLGVTLIIKMREFVRSLNVDHEEIVTDYTPELVEKWVRRGFRPVQVIYRKEV